MKGSENCFVFLVVSFTAGAYGVNSEKLTDDFHYHIKDSVNSALVAEMCAIVFRGVRLRIFLAATEITVIISVGIKVSRCGNFLLLFYCFVILVDICYIVLIH